MSSTNRARKNSTSSLSNNTKRSSQRVYASDNPHSTSLADSGIAEINDRVYSVSGVVSPLPQGGRVNFQESNFSMIRPVNSRERLDGDSGFGFKWSEKADRRQSCFESGTLPANLNNARASLDPHVTLDLLNRQVNLEKREKELADATREALAKAEEAEKMLNKMVDQDRELDELRSENEVLQDELDIKNNRIEELEMYSAEQREQLAAMRQKAAKVQSEADKMKVSHMALENSSPYEDLLSKYQNMVFERDNLVMNCEQLRENLSQLRTENASLKSSVTALTKVKQQEEDKLEESRDKATLLSVIREKIDEKVQWERYACDLVYRIVTKDPAMLENVSNGSNGGSNRLNSEACWEAYARALLSEVMNKAPNILHELDQPDNIPPDHCSYSECSLEIG